MKAIMVRAWMSDVTFAMPCYRTTRILTYPLPPYSTVIGMVHAICGWDTYHELKVSVAGNGIMSNEEVEKVWKGGQIGTETEEFKKRFPVRFPTGDGRVVGWVSTISYRNMITDLDLRLHIVGKDEEENKEIYKNMLMPKIYPSLGRYGDLIRIDDVQEVEIEGNKDVVLDMDAYVPVTPENEKKMFGSTLNLHKKYKL